MNLIAYLDMVAKKTNWLISGINGGEYEDDLSSGMLRREVYRRFRGACCLHHHRPDDGGSKYL
jgi:hypothetical protein